MLQSNQLPVLTANVLHELWAEKWPYKRAAKLILLWFFFFFREDSKTIPNWQFSLLLRGDCSVFVWWIKRSPFLTGCLQRHTFFTDYRPAPRFLKRVGKTDWKRENTSFGWSGIENEGKTQGKEGHGDFSLLFLLLPALWVGRRAGEDPPAFGRATLYRSCHYTKHNSYLTTSSDQSGFHGLSLDKGATVTSLLPPSCLLLWKTFYLICHQGRPWLWVVMLEEGIPIFLPSHTRACHCLDVLKDNTSSSGSVLAV